MKKFILKSIEKATLARTMMIPTIEERPIITIPVVFHIVYKTSEQNIPDSQIASQMKVLNQDFRMLNEDITKIPEPFKHLAADARIEFKLAKKDPEGNPTNGITRTSTNQNSFEVPGFNEPDKVKHGNLGGKDPWDTTKYLNIWVCNIEGGTLGYATPPGMTDIEDGVVINCICLGSEGNLDPDYNKGRTATHEVGHYLDLYHIWGPEDPRTGGSCSTSDNVPDTPNQLTANFGSPDFPHITCNNQPNGDMFMNYMDYVFDISMFMFTKGQAKRMDAALNGPRLSLQYSDVLIEPRALNSSLITDQLRQSDGAEKLYNGVEFVEPSQIFSL